MKVIINKDSDFVRISFFDDQIGQYHIKLQHQDYEDLLAIMDKAAQPVDGFDLQITTIIQNQFK